MVKITAIVHTDCNGLIGVDGKLAYRSKEDLQFFKNYTSANQNAVLVMGRKTFEECGPLPGRRILVLSSKGNYYCDAIKTSMTVLDLYNSDAEVILCGGSQVYNKYLFLCSEVVVNFTKQEIKSPGSNPTYFDLASLKSLFKVSEFKHYESFSQKGYVARRELHKKFSSVDWRQGVVAPMLLNEEYDFHWYNPQHKAENGSDEYFDSSEIHDTLVEARAAVRTKLSKHLSRLENEKYAVLKAFETLNKNNDKSDISY